MLKCFFNYGSINANTDTLNHMVIVTGVHNGVGGVLSECLCYLVIFEQRPPAPTCNWRP